MALGKAVNLNLTFTVTLVHWLNTGAVDAHTFATVQVKAVQSLLPLNWI